MRHAFYGVGLWLAVRMVGVSRAPSDDAIPIDPTVIDRISQDFASYCASGR